MPNFKTIFCSVCQKSILRKAFPGHLRSNIHKNNTVLHYDVGVETVNSAFKGRIVSYRISAERERAPNGEELAITSPLHFMHSISSRLQKVLDSAIASHVSVKVNFELFVKVILPRDDSMEIKSFTTENIPLFQNYTFNDLLENVSQVICKKIDEFQEKGSGWSLLDILYIETNINKYSPLGGSSYIDLPKKIRAKKACINVRNSDEYCFAWTVMSALYPDVKNPNRVSSYPYFTDVLNVDNMHFPVSLKDIKTFEINNNDISINVYGIDEKQNIIGPLYKTLIRKKTHVNMLLLEKDGKSHYCLIKDLTKLVRNQVTKHHSKLHFCDECLLFFKSEQDHDGHVCGGVVTLLPDSGTIMQFKNYHCMQDVPFVIYADFETILEPYSESTGACTAKVQKHLPAAFAYYIVCNYDNSRNHLVTYRGTDCATVFVKSLKKDIKKIYKLIKSASESPVPIIYDEEDQKNFERADNCYLCSHLLIDDKVRDHCHFTGKYRGAAHSSCNLKFRIPKFIPVFFHNLSGYDCHLFIRELSSFPGEIKVIPKNKENYISFTKFIQISSTNFFAVRFVDSFKFLGTSLEQLAKNLQQKDYINLRAYCDNESQFTLLRRKGVYPYSYMSNWQVYEEKNLPPIEKFYNNLTDEALSESDYDHAKNVWHCFNITNLGEYTDLYVKSDVLILSDIFEKFRKTCKINYDLDPAFYLTAPSLSFDAMLLKTKVKLELLSDLEMIRMIQKGIRGGICLCSKRYAKSNNHYQPNYDPSQPSRYLMYVDCNNLYGFAMCSYLPYADFKLINEKECEKLDITNIPNDNDYGYILEVDLEYPEKLHDLHNDLPFCAENFTPPGAKNVKLIPNLYNKYNYIIHYIHLKTCIQNGLRLKKIHKGISFRQSPYLKEYIDLNTHLRQNSNSLFEQDFFKLLNNSIFGKTLEDTERRVDVKLVSTWRDERNKTKKMFTAEQLISRPNFHSVSIFDENLVAIQLKREKVILDKPIYIGFTVLELSKNHMYDFHYSVMKNYYNDKLSLCYTDTDSLLYCIETNDFYSDLKENFLDYFDTSNYVLDNCFDIIPKNKKVPGLFKDELGGKILLEFVGLRSKLYSLRTNSYEVKKAKGVKKNVTKKLKFSDYTNVLSTGKELRGKNILFKTIKHQIFTTEQNKVALSRKDDKRFIAKDNISTLSWGHYYITV
ncbi:hypothetical protein ABMA28_002311 [Loxostege sticticalis]|uniref:DNA-directed DNA polymerase n=1 Tax=Loxostege sticticalis TaxID=481309 RepID=A0ABD0SJA4_LOXSC